MHDGADDVHAVSSILLRHELYELDTAASRYSSHRAERIFGSAERRLRAMEIKKEERASVSVLNVLAELRKQQEEIYLRKREESKLITAEEIEAMKSFWAEKSQESYEAALSDYKWRTDESVAAYEAMLDGEDRKAANVRQKRASVQKQLSTTANTERIPREVPLRREVPGWWSLPQRANVQQGARSWDKRAMKHKAQAVDTLQLLPGRADREDLNRQFDRAHLNVRRNRYVGAAAQDEEGAIKPFERRTADLLIFEPQPFLSSSPRFSHVIRRDEVRKVGAAAELEHGFIWKDRPTNADSGDLHDTPEFNEKVFNVLFDRTIKYNHQSLARYILANDGDSGSDSDSDEGIDQLGKLSGRNRNADILANGFPEEVSEVKAVLAEHYNAIHSVYDYYAVLGAKSEVADGQQNALSGQLNANSVTMISHNAFRQLVNDSKMMIKGSTEFGWVTVDLVFGAIDAGATCAANVRCFCCNSKLANGLMIPRSEMFEDEVFKVKRMLNRREFLSAIVRLALARHVRTGELADASDAVHHFITHTLLPRVPCEALQDGTRFRNEHCYNAETNKMLLRHEASLSAIFWSYAAVNDQASLDPMSAEDAIDFSEWITLLEDLDLIDEGFTRREASLCFVWSRMRTVDDGTKRARRKLVQLWWWDFLEAMVRVSMMMSLPTDEELLEGDFLDAGHYVCQLKYDYPLKYAAFLKSHPSRGFERPTKPGAKAVGQLMSIICRTMALKVQGISPDSGTPLVPITKQAVESLKRGPQM